MTDPLLRPETLASMRAYTGRARPDTAQIKRAPTDRTADGWEPRQAPTLASVSCLIIPPARGQVDATTGRTLTTTATRLALPTGSDVEVRDFLVVGSRLFRVTSLVNASEAHQAQLIVECEEIR